MSTLGKRYSRPVPTAMACIFFVFKKTRTAEEIATLMGVHIDQVYRSLNEAEAEGLVRRARLKGGQPFYWRRAI